MKGHFTTNMQSIGIHDEKVKEHLASNFRDMKNMPLNAVPFPEDFLCLSFAPHRGPILFLLAVCKNASTNANSAIFVQLFHDLQTFN